MSSRPQCIIGTQIADTLDITRTRAAGRIAQHSPSPTRDVGPVFVPRGPPSYIDRPVFERVASESSRRDRIARRRHLVSRMRNGTAEAIVARPALFTLSSRVRYLPSGVRRPIHLFLT